MGGGTRRGPCSLQGMGRGSLGREKRSGWAGWMDEHWRLRSAWREAVDLTLKSEGRQDGIKCGGSWTFVFGEEQGGLPDPREDLGVVWPGKSRGASGEVQLSLWLYGSESNCGSGLCGSISCQVRMAARWQKEKTRKKNP